MFKKKPIRKYVPRNRIKEFFVNLSNMLDDCKKAESEGKVGMLAEYRFWEWVTYELLEISMSVIVDKMSYSGSLTNPYIEYFVVKNKK